MAMIDRIQYRVKPVTRYIITRYESSLNGEQSVDTKGQYDNSDVAYEVAYALCKAEHERHGGEPGDERFVYPSTQDFPVLSDPDTWNSQASSPRPSNHYAGVKVDG